MNSDIEKNVFLRCDCNAETVVFTKIDWDCDDTDYCFTFEDSYCGNDYMGIKGRFKRAWHAFWAKPICHTEVVVDDIQRMKKFLQDCLELME